MVINFKEGVQARNENALLQLLADKDAEYQKRVLAVAVEYGLKTNDPLFLVMLATGQLQVILEDKPHELSALFDRWTEAIHDQLETAKRTATKGQEIEIRKMVDRLIAYCSAKERSRLSLMLPAFGLFVAAMGLGFLGGMAVPIWLQGGYAPGQKITMDAAESLRWAQSSQGQLARNIVTWNSESLANLNCTKLAAQQSLVAKEKGKAAVSQYCLLRVKPVQ
ncbi:hypothetical protein NIES2119_31345 [[Phormidium ambiguum] IAM M-71]|uniref:Uncharacterized protein n=1 Tax=[Phormidium ambiguum] IAM M-71 TaxID=454136 RepID=A0A1U7I2G9_9CYAN|nr:DUF6753 family protein [Phormidium ambiguum]OKH30230.1 hypothetical protein NIES2119_31345 [Phormidium ambiguum IAM M-71]